MGRRIGNIIFIAYSLLIASCYILPQLQYYVNIQILAILTFIFFTIFGIKQIGIKQLNILIWSIPFLMIFFIVSKSLDFKYGLLHPALLLWITIFPAFMYKTIEARGSKVEHIVLLISILSLICMVILNTISVMHDNPTIAREMTSSLTDEDYLREMKLTGVGGFGISYASGLLVLCCLTVVLNTRLKNVRIISSILCLLFLYMVFNAQFTTLIIITIACIGVLMYKQTNKPHYKYLIIVVFILCLIMVPVILQQVIAIYGDSPVSDNLIRLYNNLAGIGKDSQRDIYRNNCIELMCDSPFWGRNVDGEYQYLYNHAHSTILSYGLATGFVGVGFYLMTLLKAFQASVSNLGLPLFGKSCFPIILYYLLLSFFNPTNSLEINFVFFLTIPLIYNCSFFNKLS